MKNTIEKIVKFGIPFLIVPIIIFVVFFASGGDAEFGSIGQSGAIFLLLVIFLILYLIVGIIVWAVSKNNFIFLSAIFSIAMIIITVFISIKIKKIQTNNSSKIRHTEIQKELKVVDKEIENLTLKIEKDPTNGNLIAERAIIKRKRAGNAISNKLIKEFELAAKMKSSNIEVYRAFVFHFYGNHQKIIKYYKNALIYDSLGQLKFSEDDKKEISEKLKYYKKQETDKISYCNKKIAESGENSEILMERAEAYFNLGISKKAFSDIDEALKLADKKHIILSQKAYYYKEIEEYEKALKIYEELLEKEKNKSFYQARIDEVKIKMNENK